MACKLIRDGICLDKSGVVPKYDRLQQQAFGCLNSVLHCPIFQLRLLSLFILLFYSACAKVGEPQPPIVYIPQPSVDLACRQISGQVALTVSFPSVNTNGTPVNDLKTVEVFRVDADAAQAVILITEENFLKIGTKILSISEADFPKYKRNNKLIFSDPLPPRDAVGLYSKARIYSVRFLNRKGQTAGFGNKVSLVPIPVPLPPVLLPAVVTQDTVRLEWDPPAENFDGSKPARILGYNVYRSTDSQDLPETPLNQRPLQQPEYDDHDFEFDKSYTYAVSAVASEMSPFAESSPSKPLSIMPRDTFPPGIPMNLDAIAESSAIILLWTPPSESDIAGYRIYRNDGGTIPKRLLNAELIKTFSYRDTTIQPGEKYFYSVTAVDIYDNESSAASVVADVQ